MADGPTALPPLPPGATPLNFGAPQAAPAPQAGQVPDGLPPLPPGATPLTFGAAAARQPAAAPQGQQGAAAQPQAPAAPPEGTYTFQGPNGAVEVPYSKALEMLGHPEGALGSGQSEVDRYKQSLIDLQKRGYTLASEDMPRLYSDYANDPKLKDIRWQNFEKSIPLLQTGVGAARSAAAKVAGLAHAADIPVPTAAKTFANAKNENMWQSYGKFLEDSAEFASASRLLEGLGGILKSGVTLTEAARVENEIQKGSILGRLAVHALNPGLIGGAQTYAVTGGDTGQAIHSGLANAGIGGILGGLSEGAGMAGDSIATTPKPGVPEYAAAARDAIEPTIDDLNAARERPIMANQPGGEPAVPTGKTILPTGVSRIDKPAVLAATHDLTGASDRLMALGDEIYTRFDQGTQTKFRQLNSEVSAAGQAAVDGGPKEQEFYRQKLGEMDDLIDANKGKITPAELQATKAAFRQGYLLKDIGGLLDRNIDTIPGATKASEVEPNIDGKGLMRDLQKAVQMHGRIAVDKALGDGGIETYEGIARANQTSAGRTAFNAAVGEVARYLPIYMGSKIGEKMAGIPGLIIGGTIGAGFKPGAVRVLDAIKSNPQVAKNLFYAIKAGAKPETYAPFIAGLIQPDAGAQQQETPQQ